MDIIQRNFMRLLRCGAFASATATPDRIEPMSQWKWNKLYQVAQIHGVTPWIRDGINRSSDDFFLQLRPELRQQFDADKTETREQLGQQELSNPILNHKLQQLAEESGSEDPTFNLLLQLVHIARNIITQGISLRQLIILGVYLRTTHDPIEYEVLKTWITRLDMQRIVLLEGSLLVELFHFNPEEIRFTNAATSKATRRAMNDIFQLTEKKAADWYFTQGKSIFVRTSDSDAMMWHVRQSARYLSYYPAEAISSFIRNFTHSMSHIEE
jgi:hypothetical protein